MEQVSSSPGSSSLGDRFCQVCCTPTVRWSAYFGLATCLYVIVISSCFSLLFRFLLHEILLYSALFVVAYAYTLRLIRQRLQADYPVQSARILRTKTVPATPHPQITQKTFCWVQLLDDEEEELERQDKNKSSLVTVQSGNNNNATKNTNTNVAHDADELAQDDDRDWVHVPYVILDTPTSVSQKQQEQQQSDDNNSNNVDRPLVGQILQVSLVEGDPTRLIYLPFQISSHERIQRSLIKCLIASVVASLALHFFYRGIPIMFANSQQLQDRINADSDWFWNAIGLGDDDESETEDDLDCRIPWYVAAAYNGLIGLLFAMPVTMMLHVRWKTKAYLSMEQQAPTDHYHLLSSRDDDGGAAAAATTAATVQQQQVPPSRGPE